MCASDDGCTGIGHRVKSLENPDTRVSLIKKFVQEHFGSSPVLDYACAVERLTAKKRSNLILNVDGAIACAFVDLLRCCGVFTLEEVQLAVLLPRAVLTVAMPLVVLSVCATGFGQSKECVKRGTLNGLFVLGRSVGLIGHFIDQNRLKQGLYRHPTDDISYFVGQDLAL